MNTCAVGAVFYYDGEYHRPPPRTLTQIIDIPAEDQSILWWAWDAYADLDPASRSSIILRPLLAPIRSLFTLARLTVRRWGVRSARRHRRARHGAFRLLWSGRRGTLIPAAASTDPARFRCLTSAFPTPRPEAVRVIPQLGVRKITSYAKETVRAELKDEQPPTLSD